MLRKYWSVIGLLMTLMVLFLMFETLKLASPVNESVRFPLVDAPSRRETGMSSSKPKEVRHIGFLKVHKAASSTMQNMFFRFGGKRNLTFVFTTHPNYFSRSAGSHLPLVPPKKRDGSYDILCNHGIFSKAVYSSLLPNDTVYIGIVRDPLEVFISGVNYFTQKFQMLPYLNRVPGNKVKNLIHKANIYDRGIFSYTRNVMARDFGFSTTKDETVIQNKLDELGSIFKLVLVVEYFDESLVLMKHYLSWKLQDILYLPNNVYTKTGYSDNDLSLDDKVAFKDRNMLDYKVYDYFSSKLWQQFKSEPEEIHDEVLNFKRVINLLSIFCRGKDKVDELVVKESPWNERFTMAASECNDMTLDEQLFIKRLRTAQGSELNRH